MIKFKERLANMNAYQAKIQSKSTYLYMMYETEFLTSNFTTILADTDEEAIEIAKMLSEKAIWLRRDHWGFGPRIDIKGII